MVNIIAEIGINHNGEIELCKKMMLLAKVAGADYAKIQKRNPDVCVPEAQKMISKDTPWGKMNYIDYKHCIEFNEEQIKELCDYAANIGIGFFASVWDLDSVKLMSKYTHIAKLGSAVINDLELCKAARESFDFLIISTGMSTENEILQCIDVCDPDVVMHTNSTYPCPVEDLNLRYIEYLMETHIKPEIGWSSHCFGLVPTYAAIGMGVTWIEHHVTLDREMWGSDQKSSVEPDGLIKLVKGVRAIEKAMQYPPGPRKQFDKENEKRKALRRF